MVPHRHLPADLAKKHQKQKIKTLNLKPKKQIHGIGIDEVWIKYR